MGLDIVTGKPMLAEEAGVLDNTIVKRQLLNLGTIIATKLLLVDEIMRAGKRQGGGGPPQGGQGPPPGMM